MNPRLSLISEIHELEQILSNIPAENVIDRMSFESRLKIVKEELAILPQEGKTVFARLTFRGKPVFGTHGVLADFGSKAATLFSDVFSTIISESGPIPGKDAPPLLITGTAVGSFGFEFGLPPKEESLFPDMVDPSENAMKKIENLFRLAAEGSDDDIAEQIADMHSRTIKKIHEFLDFMTQQEAWCGLESDDIFFRFTDWEQIKYAASRFSDNNIQEYEEPCKGKFQGVLPTSRTFEFKLSTQDNVIRGKIDRAVDEPETINHKWLDKPVTAKFHVMKIGQGRPRYALMSLGDISN
jgi:hypothetical protein